MGQYQISRDRSEQTELPEPVKIRFSGRLRGRIGERIGDRTTTKDGDEWVVSDDADPRDAAAYRPFDRQKTNLVIETVDEAYAIAKTFDHYAYGDVHWMNESMARAARRVRDEAIDAVDGVDFIESKIDGDGITTFEDLREDP